MHAVKVEANVVTFNATLSSLAFCSHSPLAQADLTFRSDLGDIAGPKVERTLKNLMFDPLRCAGEAQACKKIFELVRRCFLLVFNSFVVDEQKNV